MAFMPKFGRWVCWLISLIFFPITVSGKENVPAKGGFILASNHLSFIDPPTIGIACPRYLNYMAKAELFDVPLFGGILRSVDAFPVKREGGDIGAIREAIRRVKNGGGLLIFPEGTRGDGTKMLPPQPGLGFLITKLNAPVIPVFTKGTEKVLPRHARFMRRHRVSVTFGKPVAIEPKTPYEEIARRVMDGIRQLQEC